MAIGPSYSGTSTHDEKLTYVLDQVNNWDSVTSSTNGTTDFQQNPDNNEYLSYGPVGAAIPLTYDQNGNLASDGSRIFVYDYLDRLCEIYVDSGSQAATSSSSSTKTSSKKPTKLTLTQVRDFLSKERAKDLTKKALSTGIGSAGSKKPSQSGSRTSFLPHSKPEGQAAANPGRQAKRSAQVTGGRGLSSSWIPARGRDAADTSARLPCEPHQPGLPIWPEPSIVRGSSHISCVAPDQEPRSETRIPATAARTMSDNPSRGHFVWYDLMTQDPERAKTYYTELFGYQVQAIDSGPMPYSMLSVEGETFAGMVDLSGSEEMKGIPSHWMSYIEVEDSREAAARCVELGGKVIKEPQDIPGYGSFAVLQDPTGGVFSAWTSEQPKPPRGFDQMKPGMVCWNELVTTDVDAARSFYRELLGWNEEEMSMGEMGTYYIQKVGDTGLGGIMQAPMEGIPTAWCNYFMVPKTDEWNQRALDLGGSQIQPPTDIPGAGRFSVLCDPTGGAFALWEVAENSTEC